MTTFVLILTLASGYGSSMTSIPGFESDAACQAAGQEWSQSVKSGKPTYVCVGQTKK